jgi:hypothetical protein
MRGNETVTHVAEDAPDVQRLVGEWEVARTLVREFQNTQSPRLRFRALLTEGGDRKVQLHSA